MLVDPDFFRSRHPSGHGDLPVLFINGRIQKTVMDHYKLDGRKDCFPFQKNIHIILIIGT
jgi:hypothetical protein